MDSSLGQRALINVNRRRRALIGLSPAWIKHKVPM